MWTRCDFSPIRDSRTTQDFYCILRGRAVHHKALTMGPSLSTLCVQGDHGFGRSMHVTVAHDWVWYIQALIDNWKHLDFGMYMPACYLTSTPHAEVMWAWPCEPFLCVCLCVCVRVCLFGMTYWNIEFLVPPKLTMEWIAWPSAHTYVYVHLSTVKASHCMLCVHPTASQLAVM